MSASGTAAGDDRRDGRSPSVREVLAACAAATAVSTPPAPAGEMAVRPGPDGRGQVPDDDERDAA